jgi:hypothetical protein
MPRVVRMLDGRVAQDDHKEHNGMPSGVPAPEAPQSGGEPVDGGAEREAEGAG